MIGHKYKSIVCILLVCIMTIALCSCSLPSKNDKGYTKNGFYLDTIITITLYCDDAKEQVNNCFKIAEKYDNLLSRTKENSDVSRINNAKGQFVEVDADTIELIKQGIYYGELSNGAFDITIGRLTTLWDIQNRTVPPTEAEIADKTGFSYKNIEVNGNSVRLLSDKEMIDLGGIAKGYIADKIKEYLLTQGINEGVINLGGNVVCLDKKNGRDEYTIGIQKPYDESGRPLCSINVYNKSIVTSGDYQRYFEYNGNKYHHILDVVTGYPVDNDLDSVTIINNSSTAGDALSTIAFTYGLDKGKAFIEALPDTEAIFVTKEGKAITTNNVTINTK